MSAAGATPSVPGPIHPLLAQQREYPFVALQKRQAELVPAGVPLIDFSIGDPRERTPEFVREALRAASASRSIRNGISCR